MGKASFFGCLLGPAWLIKEGIRSEIECARNSSKAEMVKAFVKENTDEALELEFVRKIIDKKEFDNIWATLEIFKRNNPIWCKMRDRESPSVRNWIKWKDVGNRRCCKLDDLLIGRAKSYLNWYGGEIQRFTIEQESYFCTLPDHVETECKSILRMLMDTVGKMTVYEATYKGTNKYCPL